MPRVLLLASALAATTLAAGAEATTPDPPFDYFPRWSPDGRSVVFERDGALTAMNANGGRLRRLPGWMPADVSRNGRIVFEQKSGYGTYLVVARLDGSAMRRVTGGPFDDTFPHWSPDGRTILFERRGRGQDVWSVRADGRGLRRLTRDRRSALDVTGEPWAPDGRRFVYDGCSVKCGDVYVRDAQGRSRPRRLTRNGGNESATWSPDGSLIAFFSGGNEAGEPHVSAELNVVRPDGSGRRNVSRARTRALYLDRDGREMSWSPDGRWIVFAAASIRDPEGSAHLWVVRHDGSRARLLLHASNRAGADDHVPAWSPDGRWIAFARVVGANDEEAPLSASLYAVRPDGSAFRRLTR
jgi:Tol biopolymer transport system component